MYKIYTQILYTKSFNIDLVQSNKMPKNPHTCAFLVLYFHTFDYSACNWIVCLICFKIIAARNFSRFPYMQLYYIYRHMLIITLKSCHHGRFNVMQILDIIEVYFCTMHAMILHFLHIKIQKISLYYKHYTRPVSVYHINFFDTYILCWYKEIRCLIITLFP
jgi:hypothetical protein